MPWTPPVSPTAGTIITVAYATANIVNPITWLRVMTGNADPPGSNYVLAATSASSTTWAKVTGDMLATGTIPPSALSTPYLPLAGGTLTGQLQISTGGLDLTGGLILRTAGQIIQAGGLDVSGGLIVRTGGLDVSGGLIVRTGGLDVTGQTLLRDTLMFNDVGDGVTLGAGGRIVDLASPERTQLQAAGGIARVTNEAATSTYAEFGTSGIGLVVPSLGASITGGLIVNNGLNLTGPSTIHDELTFSDTGDGITLSAGGRIHDMAAPERTQLQAAGGVLSVTDEAGTSTYAQFGSGGVGLVVPSLGASITGGLIVNNGIAVHGTMTIDNATLVANLNADLLDGRNTGTAAGNIAFYDASGQVAAAANGVPSGMIAAFDTATPPAGWNHYASADGRLLIGDGTALGSTWTLGQQVGTMGWTAHGHGRTGLGVGSTFAGTAAATGDGSGATQQSNVSTPSPNVSLGTHTHTYTPAGTVTTTLSGTIDATSLTPAMKVVHWAQKA